MGLDFGIYWANKGYTPKDELIDNTFSKNELCYGRKSWEVINKMGLNINDYDCELTKEQWDKLMEAIAPIGGKLRSIMDAFDREYNAPDDYPELVFKDEHKALIAEYEYWYNKTFKDRPVLGYDFSVYYMINFWEAKDLVYKYLEDPNYQVRRYISY